MIIGVAEHVRSGYEASHLEFSVHIFAPFSVGYPSLYCSCITPGYGVTVLVSVVCLLALSMRLR